MPLPPPVSAPARQTIRTAFEDLGRTITPADSRDFSASTLQQVQEAALKIERQLAARGSLRNMRRLMPLFNGLEHYSKVMDVLCNGTPYLPWIWAPITLILRIASEYVDAFEQLIKGYSQIAVSLGRFEILSNAFIGNSDFQQTLAVFYADILQFHKHAYKFVRRSGWRLLFLTSWGRFQRRFDNILEDMKRHETLIDLEANARNIAEAKEMRHDIRRWREQSLETMASLDGEESAKQYQSIISWLNMDESDQLAIFESISVEGRKHPGTCSWVLKNAKITSWLQSKPDTSILWLQGSPGSGKSVISTQIANFMQASNMFVIHHFCTYLYTSSTTYEQILRSLLMQLLRKDSDLVAHVYEAFVLGKKSPTIPTLERLLQLLFKSLSNEPSKAEYTWIILDGLDECEQEKQARVVSLMNQIASDRSSSGITTCKVLISSRTSPVLSNCLRKQQTISLSEEKISLEEAIRQYASQRLQSLEKKFHQLHISPEEVANIEHGIAKKADGMFLYARLVLDYLSTNIFYSGDEILTSVNQLPEKLSDFYRKILLQILTHLDTRSESRVKCILSWIAFAKRPLKRLELLSAITFSSGEPEVTHLVPEYVLDMCGPLIEERSDTTLTFIHVSVKEFLQTSSSNLAINKKDSLHDHGVATVSCLLSGLQIFRNTYSESARCLRIIKGIHGFHVYASEFWTEYLLSSAECGSGNLDTDSPLLILACKMANILDEAMSPVFREKLGHQPDELDERMLFLRQHPTLYKHVEWALKGRSLKRLEAELFPESTPVSTTRPSKSLPPLDGISTMLMLYQNTVKSLLDQHDYPGVTAEELELFKSQFRASAFTCRLKSCPRATLGFESEKLRLQHEKTHIRRWECAFANCKFPSFTSPQALKTHTSKHHGYSSPPKSIRSIPVSRGPTSVSMHGHCLSRTQQDKTTPQGTNQKAHESREKRKLPVGDDNSPSGNGDQSVVPLNTTNDLGQPPSLETVRPTCCIPGCKSPLFTLLACFGHRFCDASFTRKPISQSLPWPENALSRSKTPPLPLPSDHPSSKEDIDVTPRDVSKNKEQEQRNIAKPPQVQTDPSSFATTFSIDNNLQSTSQISSVIEQVRMENSPKHPDVYDKQATIEENTTKDIPELKDEEGEKKVLQNGLLTGNRKYRLQTFLRSQIDDTHYMLDEECENMLGNSHKKFRSSGGYSKTILLDSSEEINHVLSQFLDYYPLGANPTRIVDARSVFRQFGHKVIEGGRPVHDDYWVAKSREKLKADLTTQAEEFLER
ncbi:hypothetical protein V8C35DRAFT_221248 [Trichoderma chlorosporum]